MKVFHEYYRNELKKIAKEKAVGFLFPLLFPICYELLITSIIRFAAFSAAFTKNESKETEDSFPAISDNARIIQKVFHTGNILVQQLQLPFRQQSD